MNYVFSPGVRIQVLVSVDVFIGVFPAMEDIFPIRPEKFAGLRDLFSPTQLCSFQLKNFQFGKSLISC